MDDFKALQAILDKLDGLEHKVDGLENGQKEIKADIAEIKEDAAVTRNGVNTLLDWAEKVEVQVSIPLYQKGRE